MFGGNVKSSNTLFDGNGKRSSALFVDEDERLNAPSSRERRYCCNVKNSCAEHSLHRDEGTGPMALFRGEQEYGLPFENRQGEFSGQINLNFETEKGTQCQARRRNKMLDGHTCRGRSK